jgi:dipeptidyl aminopeptidase/acylaminoacyl peptidase
VELIGAGGMGEVYRARDTRLGRDVAIKLLPAEVSHDTAALARFDRGARAVAALSHPHIEALFDIGDAVGGEAARLRFGAAAAQARTLGRVELLLVDEKGHNEPLPGFDRPLVSPQLRFSPDGRLLAFNEQERTGLLWLFDVERQTYRAVSDRGIAGSPRWSPDGKRLAVSWSEFGPMQLWIVPAERGDWEQLTTMDHMVWSPSWSPDGRFLAFTDLGRSADICIYRFEDREIVPFLAKQASEAFPEFSPDGRWLAYASNESGRFRGLRHVLPRPGEDDHRVSRGRADAGLVP